MTGSGLWQDEAPRDWRRQARAFSGEVGTGRGKKMGLGRNGFLRGSALEQEGLPRVELVHATIGLGDIARDRELAKCQPLQLPGIEEADAARRLAGDDRPMIVGKADADEGDALGFRSPSFFEPGADLL